MLNAVVAWFDLHLDEETAITSAPTGVGLKGSCLSGKMLCSPVAHDAGDSDDMTMTATPGARAYDMHSCSAANGDIANGTQSTATANEAASAGAEASAEGHGAIKKALASQEIGCSASKDSMQTRVPETGAAAKAPDVLSSKDTLCKPETPTSGGTGPKAKYAGSEGGHYWGQALQFLQFAVAVARGEPPALSVCRHLQRQHTVHVNALRQIFLVGLEFGHCALLVSLYQHWFCRGNIFTCSGCAYLIAPCVLCY